MLNYFAFAFLSLITAASSLAGEVRIEIGGEVNTNWGGPPDIYGTVSKGSNVQMSFRVLTPGTVVVPGQEIDYDIIPSSFRIVYVGVPVTTMTAPAKLRLVNDANGEIYISFENGGSIDLANGTSALLGISGTTTLIGQTDIEQLGGSFSFDFGSMIHGPLVINWLQFTIDASLEGARFCDPMETNSTGDSTDVTASRSTAPGSPVHLEPRFGPAFQFGYFLVGTAANDPGIPISEGHLCLSTVPGELLGRFNVGGTPMNSLGQFNILGLFTNMSNTSSTGFGFDVPNTLPFPGNPALMAGETWHYQLWHRDLNAGVSVSNFSNGVSVTY